MSPTNEHCNDAYCNFHGWCLEDVCTCYKGFKGELCSATEELEKARHVEVDVFWGLKGIDRTEIDEDFVAGVPVFDSSFRVSGEAQLFLKDSCDMFRRANSTLRTFPKGSNWICMWETFDSWLVSSTGSGMPLEEEDLFDKIAGTGEGSDDGFLGVYSVLIDGVRTRTSHFSGYVGLDREERRITWVRLGIDTSLEDSMDATKAEVFHERWKAFLKDEVDGKAPEELGRAKMSSFLWVRIATELSLVRSTITAWAISNASAFIVILLFTRSLYIASITTVCIFFIIVSLACFMICVMKWPFGAMEALSITIFVGLACDYCLHIAHAFMHSPAANDKLKAREALTKVGKSVLGAAITTVSSSVCLLFCVIVFFNKMGIIIIVNSIGSLFFALVFFPSLLSVGGGGSGSDKVVVVVGGGEEGSCEEEEGEEGGGEAEDSMQRGGGGGGGVGGREEEAETIEMEMIEGGEMIEDGSAATAAAAEVELKSKKLRGPSGAAMW